MNLVKCPQCGELYSPSYPRCPFCEEDGEIDSKGKSKPKRHIGGRRAGQSARGGLIVVLVLVLALLSWYLFRENIIRREKNTAAQDPAAVQSQTEGTDPEGPSVPAINPTDTVKADGTDGASEKSDGENTADGNKSGESKSDNTTTTAPAVEPSPQENVDVSKAKLNNPDFTLSFAGDKYTIKLEGTDAKPIWSIDNANVATIASDGTVTAVANGHTTIHCKVGNLDLTSIVRVRNTGKNAAAAEAPTTAQSVAPVEPAKPGTATPTTPAAPAASGTDTKPAAGTTDNTKTETPAAATDSGNLYISAFGSKLPQDKRTGYYDCTVKLDGSSLTLKVAGTSQTPVWSSDNASIATVDANGVLKPVSKGTAHITATVGGTKLTCIVRVR